MSEQGLLRKDQLELSLHQEKKLVEDGKLKEDNPLDVSDNFRKLCEGCRRGDLKICQEMITAGVNINARDPFDYSPLILASLCGHYEVVQLLLEAGALCERDTFQGERCLYNALNNRIRNLLLSYDYSKSSDPLLPLALHLASLLKREQLETADITVFATQESFRLHKFILSARSPYFFKRLNAAPDTATWKLPPTIPPQAFGIAIRYFYLGEPPTDLGGGPGTGFTDSEILAGLDKISKHFEIQKLSDLILDREDRRLVRQRQSAETEKGRDQLEKWFREHVLQNTIVTDVEKASEVKWDRDNALFADVLLQADDDDQENEVLISSHASEKGKETGPSTSVLGIPLSLQQQEVDSSDLSQPSKPGCCRLFPCHRAMLIRSKFFLAMFSSSFREAQKTPHLQIIPMSCSSSVLEIILTFMYTERAGIPLSIAVEVLLAADQLFLDQLKMRAAVVISTLGNGNSSTAAATTTMTLAASAVHGETETSPETGTWNEEEPIDIYDILRAAWLTHVQRLEEFAARYIAYRLESYIEEPSFAELVKESASRISVRQETDSIELIDDIRWYLSERFRLRFEDPGLGEMMDEGHHRQQEDATEDPSPMTRLTGGRGVVGKEHDLESTINPTDPDTNTVNPHGSSESVLPQQKQRQQQQQQQQRQQQQQHQITNDKNNSPRNSETINAEGGQSVDTHTTSQPGTETATSPADRPATNNINLNPKLNDSGQLDYENNKDKTVHDRDVDSYNDAHNDDSNDDDDDDEFAKKASQYRLLLLKIDDLLARLQLDA